MQPIPISFRQIEFLLAVADTGGTAAASRLLNVSQPSVSLAITRCEEIWGQPLFVRIVGHGMELTSFGRHKIAEIRDLQKQAHSVLLGAEGLEYLDLGLFSTLGPQYGPNLIKLFKDEYPGTEIRLWEGDLGVLHQWLNEGRIDLALLYDFGTPDECDITPLRRVDPYVLCEQNHRLAKHDTVSLDDIIDEPIILINLPYSRGFFLSLLHKEGKSVHIAYETSSIEMLRSMVANGHGIGLLATDIPNTMSYDGNYIRRLKIRGELPRHQIALARSTRVNPRPVVKNFISFAEQYFDESSKQSV
nr:LysR family transcriptional regulator [uncultured Cohaesibacter sp.]